VIVKSSLNYSENQKMHLMSSTRVEAIINKDKPITSATVDAEKEKTKSTLSIENYKNQSCNAKFMNQTQTFGSLCEHYQGETEPKHHLSETLKIHTPINYTAGIFGRDYQIHRYCRKFTGGVFKAVKQQFDS
jgi:hypothetical protein